MKFKHGNKLFLILVFLFFFLSGFFIFDKKEAVLINPAVKVNLAPTPSPTPTPTPRPLTFAEMNALYGPCVYLPVLMYHHVQDMEAAKAKNQVGLTVATETFAQQMQYLKDKGYNTVSMQDLIDFFDNGTPVAKKSILITFDDGYADLATDAYPVLTGLGLKATVFLATGLVNNPGYLSWDQVVQIAPEGRILFANHTWSHKNIAAADEVMQKEILTADTQLIERNLNNPKVFSFPYGLETARAEKYITDLGYKLAFSTKPGSILCAKRRLVLPRVRIGNTPISNYGF